MLRVDTNELFDGSDAAYIIRYYLEMLIVRRIPLTMLTDSKSHFPFNFNSSMTTKYRFILYVRKERKTYDRGYISDVG